MEDSEFARKLTAFQDNVYERYMQDVDRQQAEEEAREKFTEDKLTVQDLMARLTDLPEDAVIYQDEEGLHAMIGVPDVDQEIIHREIIAWGSGDDDNTDKEYW